MAIINEVCKHCGANPAEIRRIVSRLVKAEVAASWKGSQEPCKMLFIERELKLARQKFRVLLERIST